MKKRLIHLWWIGALTFQELISNIFYIIISFTPLSALMYLPYVITTDEKLTTLLQIIIFILVAPFCLGVAITWSDIINKIKANVDEKKKDETITSGSTE